MAGGAAQGGIAAAGNASMGYDIDSLFRRAQPDGNASPGDAEEEAGRILANGLSNGDVPEADRAFLRS